MNKLSEIATVYCCYRQIMAHWRTVSGLNILDVRYEDIVDNPKENMERIIRFIGLPWEEQCMRFYEQDNFVNTASYAQVKSPIYRSSIDRWKHYESHLNFLKEALGEYWPRG